MAVYNVLLLINKIMYCPGGFMDSHNLAGNMTDEKWSSQINKVDYFCCLAKFRPVSGSPSGEDGNEP